MREDNEARLEAEALSSHKPWTAPDTPPEFIKAVDDYAEAIEQVVLARAQVRKWEMEAARLRHLIVELEAQER